MTVVVRTDDLKQLLKGISDVSEKTGTLGNVILEASGKLLKVRVEDKDIIVIKSTECSCDKDVSTSVSLIALESMLSVASDSVVIKEEGRYLQLESARCRIKSPAFKIDELVTLPDLSGFYVSVDGYELARIAKFVANTVSNPSGSLRTTDSSLVEVKGGLCSVMSTDGVHLATASTDIIDRVGNFNSLLTDKDALYRASRSIEGRVDLFSMDSFLVLRYVNGITYISKRQSSFPSTDRIFQCPAIAVVKVNRVETLKIVRLLFSCSGNGDCRISVGFDSICMVSNPSEDSRALSGGSADLNSTLLSGEPCAATVKLQDLVSAIESYQDENVLVSIHKLGHMEFVLVENERGWKQLFTVVTR